MSSFLSWWFSNTASTSSMNNSPQRKVHVGLSIDSDSSRYSETSSLSDFEEGMPLWAKESPPPRLLIPNTATEMSTPIGFQIRMPKRGASLSLDTTHETLAQRTCLKSNLSLPILNDHVATEGVRLRQRQPQEEYILESSSLRTTKLPQRLLKLFFALMAMGMVAASVNQQLYTEIMNEAPADTPSAASSKPNFPHYYLQQRQPKQPKQPQSFASGPSNQQRRSNLALARSQESPPVFGQVVAEGREFEQDYPSDSWISWLGGCAFCLVLLETGWKGYRQSRLSHEARRR